MRTPVVRVPTATREGAMLKRPRTWELGLARLSGQRRGRRRGRRRRGWGEDHARVLQHGVEAQLVRGARHHASDRGADLPDPACACRVSHDDVAAHRAGAGREAHAQQAVGRRDAPEQREPELRLARLSRAADGRVVLEAACCRLQPNLCHVGHGTHQAHGPAARDHATTPQSQLWLRHACM